MKPHSLAENLPRKFSKKRSAGFTYIGLLILLAIMGIVSAAAVQMGVVMHRRVAEDALLDVGREFSQALESYKRSTPAGQPDEPATLQDLLKDPRFPGKMRHLRKLFSDPITGQQEWGILRSEDTGRIAGVYSLSEATPIKIANFDLRLHGFEGKTSYQDWVFTRMQAVAGGWGSGKAANGAANGAGALISPMDLGDQPDAEPATDPSTNSTTDSSKKSGLISPLELL